MRSSAQILFPALMIAALSCTASLARSQSLESGISAAFDRATSSAFINGSGAFTQSVVDMTAGALAGTAGSDAGSLPYGSSSGSSTDSFLQIPYTGYSPNYVAPPAPPATYVDPNAGTFCRQYSQEIRIDGQMHESYGTACLQPDGTWHIVR